MKRFCIMCGSEFTATPSQRTYCSSECSQEDSSPVAAFSVGPTAVVQTASNDHSIASALKNLTKVTGFKHETTSFGQILASRPDPNYQKQARPAVPENYFEQMRQKSNIDLGE